MTVTACPAGKRVLPYLRGMTAEQRRVLAVGGVLALAMVLSLMTLPLLAYDGFAAVGSPWVWLEPDAFDEYLEFWEGWLVFGTLLGSIVVLGLSVAARIDDRCVLAFRLAALATAALTYGAVLANFHRNLARFFGDIAVGGVLILVLPVGMLVCAAKLGPPDVYR